jgi:hypothetical protein
MASMAVYVHTMVPVTDPARSREFYEASRRASCLWRRGVRSYDDNSGVVTPHRSIGRWLRRRLAASRRWVLR